MPPRNPLICGQGTVPYLWNGPRGSLRGPKARSIGMEQRLGSKSKGFRGDMEQNPGRSPKGGVFRNRHNVLKDGPLQLGSAAHITLSGLVACMHWFPPLCA